jgi:hypothetical protein
MLLRSPRVASHLSDPHRRFTVDAYEKANGAFAVKVPPTVTEDFIAQDMAKKIPLQDFVEYGRWFLRQADLPIDTRVVSSINLAPGGFDLVFKGGESLRAKKVVVAGGIAPFARIPRPFEDLPPCLVSHTSHHNDLSKFRHKEVLVIGAGQSALESAVLLDEAGARVQVLIRGPVMRWLGVKRRWMHGKVVGRMLYGPARATAEPVSSLATRGSRFMGTTRNSPCSLMLGKGAHSECDDEYRAICRSSSFPGRTHLRAIERRF